MLTRRTDLALEAHELWKESAGETTQLPGVRARSGTREGFPAERVEILDEEGERALGKSRGTYLTLTMDGLDRPGGELFHRAVRALASELRDLLPPPEAGPVLVVGLGNRDVTPDALGPRMAESMLVTRHLIEEVPEYFGGMRPVAAVAAGVMGDTGLESSELIFALTRQMKPACVLAVDALASRSLKRLCRTVQLTDSGISPGSGVGNHRKELSAKTLGVPVLALGVPTVVEAATLCADLLAETGRESPEPELLQGAGGDLFVTPRDIDQQIAKLSKLLGLGISMALQSDLTVEDVENLLQ